MTVMKHHNQKQIGDEFIWLTLPFVGVPAHTRAGRITIHVKHEVDLVQHDLGSLCWWRLESDPGSLFWSYLSTVQHWEKLPDECGPGLLPHRAS